MLAALPLNSIFIISFYEVDMFKYETVFGYFVDIWVV